MHNRTEYMKLGFIYRNKKKMWNKENMYFIAYRINASLFEICGSLNYSVIVVPHCITKILSPELLQYLTECFFIKEEKTEAKRFDHAYVSNALFIYILWFRGVLQSATGHWSHQKFIYSQSLLESFRTKSQSKQSAVCRGPVDEEANDQPFFNRTHQYIWNNKPAPITRMKTLQTFQWKIIYIINKSFPVRYFFFIV